MFGILAHRGWWRSRAEQNSRAAIQRAFDAGYGVETDIRDCNGRIVVSHDPPNDQAMGAEELLGLCRDRNPDIMLALNIKADGLAAPLASLLHQFAWDRYFTFDMSIPDTLGYLSRHMRVFTRRSEFETGSLIDQRAHGLWLDPFEGPCVAAETLQKSVDQGHDVALVSPELHGKPHLEAWRLWRDSLSSHPARPGQKMFLCTDFPDKADTFFSGART